MNTTPAGLRAVPDLPAIAPAELLDQVAQFVSRFSVFPDRHTAPMLALWYAHTHAIQHFYTTPRLILDSAEPGSGKTRVMEVGQYLVRKPEMTISITTAAIFRMLADGPVTLMFDEIDTIFSAKSGGNNEDLRGLLNSGYKRSATVARCVGDASRMKVERFPVFAPVVLAGIAGDMPVTITGRAVTVHMRRRARHERAEPFRERRVEAEAQPLREQLAAWLDRVGEDHLAGAEPVMPAEVTDRNAEIWEPLLAVADLAGGHWPDTARAAALHFVGQAVETAPTLGTRLLSDLRNLFLALDTDRLSSNDIIARLCADDDAGWADLGGGRPLDARRLSAELRRYGIGPGSVRIPGREKPDKGYRYDKLADAFARYLPPLPEAPSPESVTSVTPVTPQVRPLFGVTADADVTATAVTHPGDRPPDGPSPDEADVTDVAVTNRSAVTPDEPLTRHVTDVTDVTDSGEGA